MIRTLLIPLLAIIGVVFGVYMVVKASKPPAPVAPVAEPPRAPYTSFVAGAGLIEASTENIALGSQVNGVVREVVVAVGQQVKAGDVLFRIDDREQVATLAARQAALHVAKEQLERLKKQPRAEELPPAEARVTGAKAALAETQWLLSMSEQVSSRSALTEDELARRRFAVEAARAKLTEAESMLALTRAGAWAADIAVSEAQIAEAEAAVGSANTDVELRVVRAPKDGEILQVNVRAGEYAQTGRLATPLMLMGDTTTLHVRVDIDEHDAWRMKADARAEAFVRGNKDLRTVLKFVRFEPYIIPKRSLTGESTERVDTRVLQVIYSFPRNELPVFVGQQMDVYIEAPSLERPPPASGAEKKN